MAIKILNLSDTRRQQLASALSGAVLSKDHPEQSEYAQGVHDLLTLLGLFEGGPSGRAAEMMLNSLRGHVADELVIGLDWEDLDGPSPRGVDFLKVIEQARAGAVEEPTVARSVEAAVSIIKSTRGGVESYLMQYDSHARRYQPIGGKREPEDKSLEDTLRREFAEELGLPGVPGPDVFSVKEVGTWDEYSISATYGIYTHYRFLFFHVLRMRLPLPTGPLGDSITRWVTRAEMESGTAADGRPISPIYLDGLGREVLDGLAETELLV